MYPTSELLITPEGRIYHLNLKPEDIANTIILVGDPGRVDMVAAFFDEIEVEASNREYITRTGWYKSHRLTVMSTGIGVGNIDITMNELDALVNIDFASRKRKEILTSLNIIRIGTTGAMQPEIEVGSYIVSKKAVGLDGLINFHNGRDEICNLDLEDALKKYIPLLENVVHPYVIDSSEILSDLLISDKARGGITITAPGFYGTQGRQLRLQLAIPDLNDKYSDFRHNGQKITNFEMESSALFGFSKFLGHESTSICLAIANRFQKTALEDYHSQMNDLIEYTLNRIIEL
jgi:uridine phosphorylase